MIDPASLAIAAVAFLLGGILKGATGAGAPILAVPIMTMLFGVEAAIAIFALPNVLSNVGQAWAFRGAEVSRRFLWGFALAGAAGTAVGTALLFRLPDAALKFAVGASVVSYVAFKLLRPGWKLSLPGAERLAPAAGLLGGTLMGATGISAPISLTFLNAVSLPRPAFIKAVSFFFLALGSMQIPLLAANGVLTVARMSLGVAAFAIILGGMAIGGRLARRISGPTFDRLILALLFVLALKLLFDSIAG